MNKTTVNVVSSLPMAAMLLAAASGLTMASNALGPNDTVVCGEDRSGNCDNPGSECIIEGLFGNTNGTCQPTTDSNGNSTCICQS